MDLLDVTPMAYNSVEVPTNADGRRSAIDAWVADPGWVAEQKLDGTRMLARCTPGKVEAVGHGGRPVTFAAAVKRWREGGAHAALLAAGLDGWALDGELLEDGTYWLFDCPWGAGGAVTPASDFATRRRLLEMLHERMVDAEVPGWGTSVRLVPQASTSGEKADLWAGVLAAGAEGVCLKRLAGTYLCSGARHRRTDDVLKAKVVHTVDVVVTGRNRGGSLSADLAVWDPAAPEADVAGTPMRLRPIGACSMIGKPDAQVGTVIEVRYLPGTGSRLTQPRLVSLRPDKRPHECGLDQIRFADRKVLATVEPSATVTHIGTSTDLEVTPMSKSRLTLTALSAPAVALAVSHGATAQSGSSVSWTQDGEPSRKLAVAALDSLSEATALLAESAAESGPARTKLRSHQALLRKVEEMLAEDVATASPIEPVVHDAPAAEPEGTVIDAADRFAPEADGEGSLDAPEVREALAAKGYSVVAALPEDLTGVAIEALEEEPAAEAGARPIVYRREGHRTARFADVASAVRWALERVAAGEAVEVLDSTSGKGVRLSKSA